MGPRYLMDRYAVQVRAAMGDPDRLEGESELGREMAEQGWDFAWLIAERLDCPRCEAHGSVDVYSAVSPVGEATPTQGRLDGQVIAGRPTWYTTTPAVLPPLSVGTCHRCDWLVLVPTPHRPGPATAGEIAARLPRNAAGDLAGGMADCYLTGEQRE